MLKASNEGCPVRLRVNPYAKYLPNLPLYLQSRPLHPPSPSSPKTTTIPPLLPLTHILLHPPRLGTIKLDITNMSRPRQQTPRRPTLRISRLITLPFLRRPVVPRHAGDVHRLHPVEEVAVPVGEEVGFLAPVAVASLVPLPGEEGVVFE